jgi:hypothetical protein
MTVGDEIIPDPLELARQGDGAALKRLLARVAPGEHAALRAAALEAAAEAGRTTVCDDLLTGTPPLPRAALDAAFLAAVPSEDDPHERVRRRTRVLRLLIKHGADPAAGGGDALRRAAAAGALDAVRLMLEFGARPEGMNPDDYPSRDMAELIRQHQPPRT